MSAVRLLRDRLLELPRRVWLPPRMLLAFALLLAVTIASDVIVANFHLTRMEALRTSANSLMILEAIDELRLQFSRSQAENRGFLVSGKPEMLGAAGAAEQSARSALHRVRSYLGEDTEEGGRLNQLETLLHAQRLFWQSVLAARGEAPLQALAMVATGEGVARAASIDALIDTIDARAYSMLAQSNARAERTEGRFAWALVAAGLVQGAVLILAYLAFVRDWAGRARAERRLRANQERLRSLVEISSDWYWELDANLRLVDFSADATSRSGLDTNAAVGKTLWEFGHEGLTPADRELCKTTLESRQPFRDLEFARRGPDGSLAWISVSGRPVFDSGGAFRGYYGASRDITERRRREEDLQRFRMAMDATADALYLVDRASMRFIDVNQAACRMQGRTRAELLALGPDGVLSTPREELARIYDSVIAGGAATEPLEMLRQRRDGSHVWVELRRSAQRSGDSWMIVTVVRDISAHKQTEQALQRRARRQNLIATFGQQALASTDLDELLAQSVGVVTEGLGVGFCELLQLAPNGRSLMLKAGAGWAEAWLGRIVAEADADTQKRFVLDSGEPVIVEDFQRETRFAPSELLRVHGIASGVDLRLGRHGAFFGTLGAYSRSARRFTQDAVNFLRSIGNVLETAIERSRTAEKLAYLAQFDALTGLPNRNLLFDRLAQLLLQARRNRWPAAVLFIDLDRFKIVNDTYGHGVGDKLLRLVAQRLQNCVRASDTVGRLGGDEFAVLLSTLGQAGDASLVAQKVLEALAHPFDLDGRETYMTASLGIALYPSDGEDPESLLMNADAAMYQAKDHGRNIYQFYLPQMNERAAERLRMETQLRGALGRDEFVLHYQPKVDLARGSVSGFEALLRWQNAERGLVPPLEFISIIESIGLILPVGEWVVRTVCEQIRRWRAEGLRVPRIAVNVSPMQLRQKDFVATMERAMGGAKDMGGMLELEITESLIMQDIELNIAKLQALRDMGVEIAVDDFGTGYSSLSYIARLPISALKIDRAFIKNMTSNPDDLSIVSTIISLGHSLELTVIAEGVETQEQAKLLRLLKCDECQGYFYGRPLPVKGIEGLLREDKPPLRSSN